MADVAELGLPAPPGLEAFADEARAFLDAHAVRRDGSGSFEWGQGSDYVGFFGDPRGDDASDVAAARAWQRVRQANGFGWITGPKRYGGRDLSSLHDFTYDLVEAEYDTPDTEVLSVIGLGMVGPTILTHGSDYLRERYLPAMYRGDVVACQLFSEPAAGSDLAAVTTRAVRDGDAWVVNGQKVWTSGAHYSEIGELLCRTDAEAPKHRGITAFVLDMSLPGVTVRPLRQMTGGVRVQRGLPRRRTRSRLAPAGRGQRRLEGGGHDVDERARHRGRGQRRRSRSRHPAGPVARVDAGTSATPRTPWPARSSLHSPPTSWRLAH